MPQPRKYETPALRQAAYMRRVRVAQQALLSQRGLPTGPAIPSMPGTARWEAAIRQSKDLIEMICDEMQDYYEDRSETWQESEKGEDFTEKMEEIQELREQLEAMC